jgi:hypothetical protein
VWPCERPTLKLRRFLAVAEAGAAASMVGLGGGERFDRALAVMVQAVDMLVFNIAMMITITTTITTPDWASAEITLRT